MSHMTSVRQMPSNGNVEASPSKPIRSAKSYMTPTSSSKSRISARVATSYSRAMEDLASQIVKDDIKQIASPIKRSKPVIVSAEKEQSESHEVVTNQTRSVIDFNGDSDPNTGLKGTGVLSTLDQEFHGEKSITDQYCENVKAEESSSSNGEQEDGDNFEYHLSKQVRLVKEHTLTQQERHHPSRLSAVKSKVLCHNALSSPKKSMSRSPKKSMSSSPLKSMSRSPKKSIVYSESPKNMFASACEAHLTERIQSRSNQISDMEKELATAMQQIMQQREKRASKLDLPAEPLRYSPVKLTAEQYTLRFLEDSSTSQFVDNSPQRNGDQPTNCQRKPLPELDVLDETKENVLTPISETESKDYIQMTRKFEDNPQLVEMTNSSTQLYKPVLSAAKTKSSERRSVVYSAAEVKHLNSNRKSNARISTIQGTPKAAQTKREIAQPRHLQATASSKQRVSTIRQKSPLATQSPTAASNLKYSASSSVIQPCTPERRVTNVVKKPSTKIQTATNVGMDKSPDFAKGQPTNSTVDAQVGAKEFDAIRRQMSEERKQRSIDFYNQVHELTYGDYQRHDSPTQRLVKQKDETVNHKQIFNKQQSRRQAGSQFYTIGTEKSYMIKTDGHANYQTAQKRPQQFIDALNAQEIQKKKVKQGRQKSYTFSQTMGARKSELMKEKSRAALVLRGANLTPERTPKATEARAMARSVEKPRPLVNKQPRVAVLPADVQNEVNYASMSQEDLVKLADQFRNQMFCFAKSDIAELKSFKKPPMQIQAVCNVFCVMFGVETRWESALKLISSTYFLKNLLEYDIQNMSPYAVKAIKEFIRDPENSYELLIKKSNAAGAFYKYFSNLDQLLTVVRFVTGYKIEPAQKKKAPTSATKSAPKTKTRSLYSSCSKPVLTKSNLQSSVTGGRMEFKAEENETPVLKEVAFKESPVKTQEQKLTTLQDWSRQLKDSVEDIYHSSICELKAYANPPDLAKDVLNCVLICLNEKLGWSEAKKLMGEPRFVIERLGSFDMTTIGPKNLIRLNKLTSKEGMNVERVAKVSVACVTFLKWVLLVKAFGEANFGTEIYENSQ